MSTQSSYFERPLDKSNGQLSPNFQMVRDLARTVTLENYRNSPRISGANFQSSTYLSEVEQSILKSSEPIEINTSEEIEVLGQRGLWTNRHEVVNWRGEIPLAQYQINQDQNPEIVTKSSRVQLEYIQELAIRYLRPPTPPAPGEIIINKLKNELTPPAPPLIIRQQPARPSTPEPLVVREAPPQAPVQVGRKIVTISGKRIPPPARKVIIERLAALPSKPQSILIERWLPYSELKRRVIYNRPNQPDPVVVKPRNVIVQWEAPRVNIRKEIKYLGVIRANPAEYVQRYSGSLTEAGDMPGFVKEIKTPEGLVLAAESRYSGLMELYGDVEALRLINLEAEGLGEYRDYFSRLGLSSRIEVQEKALSQSLKSSQEMKLRENLLAIIEQIFRSIDTKNSGRITFEDAGKVVLRLNSRLGRNYGEDDVKALFADLDTNNDGSINFDEFKKAFVNL
ncbi:serine threonine- phosphatase with EF-hands 2-like [Brachionus plicatilis]|uniref:Serine threonine-phosphatase with EF-hands 2-like n=1 Tax=Brachionus plicatilis TaxID=10195 RepID=A0A3M7SV45_BRAPC|nr:serine threonine- phosphatase with EF-hands 2-like [Brachionus plicatilis]